MILRLKKPVEKFFEAALTLSISVFLVLSFFAAGVSARDFLGDFKASVSDLVIKRLLISDTDYPSKVMTRGEAVNRIVEAFNLRTAKADFIEGCMASADECFFVFSAMSDFDGIAFDPLRLYPDVNEKSRYYEAINTASILGLVHGYLNEEDTPFKPEVTITRIQALKILLASADLMQWKERFELAGESHEIPFSDVDPDDETKWWYPRYLDFALEAGIIEPDDLFRPDEPVTLGELAEMVDKAMRYKEDSADDTQIYA